MIPRLLQGALIATIALYLVPTGAHLFEMPAKMALTATDYMIVQRIYGGWQAFGVIIGLALLLALTHTFQVRQDRAARNLSAIALVSLAAALGDFLLFTLPVNTATRFWTIMPGQFHRLRWQWELSHAVAAVLTFTALVASIASALRSRAAG